MGDLWLLFPLALIVAVFLIVIFDDGDWTIIRKTTVTREVSRAEMDVLMRKESEGDNGDVR